MAYRESVPVLLGQVASLEIGPEIRQGAISRDGRGETVAVVVVCGVVTSTLLTLLVLPVLYEHFGGRKEEETETEAQWRRPAAEELAA